MTTRLKKLTATKHCHEDNPARPDVRRLCVVLRLHQDLRRDVRLRTATTFEKTFLALEVKKLGRLKNLFCLSETITNVLR